MTAAGVVFLYSHPSNVLREMFIVVVRFLGVLIFQLVLCRYLLLFLAIGHSA